jgi:hypothetical protein
MNPGMAAGDTAAAKDQGDTAMTHHKTLLLLALLLTATGSHQAFAGMSGTSVRVQQQSASEAQALVQAPPAARPVAQAPVRPAPARKEQAARPSAGAFDGIWAVTASPGCGLAVRSAVEVSRGRISGQGVSGSVDAGGNVRTVGYGGGLSVISKGRVSGEAGSGTYEVSNGCTGTWTSHRA